MKFHSNLGNELLINFLAKFFLFELKKELLSLFMLKNELLSLKRKIPPKSFGQQFGPLSFCMECDTFITIEIVVIFFLRSFFSFLKKLVPIFSFTFASKLNFKEKLPIFFCLKKFLVAKNKIKYLKK